MLYWLLINFIVYITVPRLNDKNVETLNKALYYSKKAYEEALAAKKLSVRTETAINDFIKEQSSLRDNGAENSNGGSKGYNSKKKFWYTVSIIFLG